MQIGRLSGFTRHTEPQTGLALWRSLVSKLQDQGCLVGYHVMLGTLPPLRRADLNKGEGPRGVGGCGKDPPMLSLPPGLEG